MTVLLVALYLLLGGVVALCVDALADGITHSVPVRLVLALVVIVVWLPFVVIGAIVGTLCLLALGITRRQ